LLNEVYLRLSQLKNAQWESRAGFFALCAEMMRRILIDHARSRQAQKRGGSAMRVPLDGIELMSEPRADELIALDDALKQLETLYPRKSRVVELKFFGGLSFEEIAEALDVSRLTVMRDWDFARAWLQAVLNGDPIDDC
jgi:RNA polymerase sigma factor (TIGR02999 family)